jgi:putative transposase
MPEDLVSEALHQPTGGLIVHSNQGSQYTATRFWDLVIEYGATQSMSRKSNCYDTPWPSPSGAGSRPNCSTAVAFPAKR